jgi:hypothetical protein
MIPITGSAAAGTQREIPHGDDGLYEYLHSRDDVKIT